MICYVICKKRNDFKDLEIDGNIEMHLKITVCGGKGVLNLPGLGQKIEAACYEHDH